MGRMSCRSGGLSMTRIARRLHPYLALFVLFTLSRLAMGATTSAAATTQSAATEEEHFLRFVGDGTKGGTLETSVAVYKNDAGVTVRLVSAVHIAEAAYFHDIQNSFEGRDAVLYEM